MEDSHIVGRLWTKPGASVGVHMLGTSLLAVTTNEKHMVVHKSAPTEGSSHRSLKAALTEDSSFSP